MPTFLHQLTQIPFAVTFAGQATPWRQGLDELAHDEAIGLNLAALVLQSDQILSPVRRSLATQSVASLPFLLPARSGQTAVTRPEGGIDEAALSVPGIVLTQLGALQALAQSGLDLRQHPAVAFEGHSQGILGVQAARAWINGQEDRVVEVVAIARLIGAAASRSTRRLGAASSAEATPMLSIRGVPESLLVDLIGGLEARRMDLSFALRNGTDTHVVSGAPADLALLKDAIEAAARADQAAHDRHEVGGRVLSPVLEFLPVHIPFHSSLLQGAVDQVMAWAQECELDSDVAEQLARAVLVDPVDWPAQVREAVQAGARWIVDLGPGQTTVRMTRALVEGTGVGVVPAGTDADRDQASTPGWEPAPVADWTSLAPRLITLADGRTVVDTRFSRLTGRSPVLLAGMTPTTVDPEIVAAAANAGYWAELAGGGQVTEEVYNENLAGLREQLKPGHAAQFNSMFLDRYLWNLQFGQARIVSRSRVNGAPIDGVVISAGIPDKEEALELIKQLRADGFPYVAFKPGTVDQIHQVIKIAQEAHPTKIIVQVEDGHSGGHHSWEDLSDLLLATYADLRTHDNIVLTVGGGIGTPERAADFLTGQWSLEHGRPAMPVDGVLVGTAAMTTKEARTTKAVKELLVQTPGVSASSAAKGWVGVGKSEGGVTSGLSHLRADMHEVDNAAAAAARLIAEIGSDGAQVRQRKAEIIEILDRTAKPYFGDLEDMTYAQWVTRFADLSFPWVDPTWQLRFHHLLQRIEARLSAVDHGEVETLFPTAQDCQDGPAAVKRILEAYPNAASTYVTPIDAAWFPTLCREYPKPMPFVPVLDDDLIRWWGQDGLWQAQDERYSADSVRIIPGPVSVGGIDRVDEPVAELLGRFENAAVERLTQAGVEASAVLTRLGNGKPASSLEEWLRTVPFISWTGHLMTNPAAVLPSERVVIDVDEAGLSLVILLDTAWDQDPHGEDKHAVRKLVFPLTLPTHDGGVPVIDEERLPEQMYAMLAATAGVGSTSVAGDAVSAMPQMVDSQLSEFGEAHYSFTLAQTLGHDHAEATGGALPASYDLAAWVPDALLGVAWPAIYAALGSAIHNDYPVIEGLLNAVHLDHSIEFNRSPEELLSEGVTTIDVRSHAASIEESSSGRIVTVVLQMSANGHPIGSTQERFAIRGRATGNRPPAPAAPYAGIDVEVRETPRSVLRQVTVQAPDDMTPFAIVSGDYNPIHTSWTAAKVAGMEAPLVHGMWLSATAQHAVSAALDGHPGLHLRSWTYYMYGTVDLNDQVEITVERTGRLAGGGLALEVTCRINKQVVSRAAATTTAGRTAYVYPGQGIQSAGMGLDERAQSPAVDAVWRRADAHTREAMGFSILAIVRDNPTSIRAKGVTYRHPDGVLNLTQFTQVALATLAIGQTERLREEGALVEGSAFAGHSLGEYTALAAYGRVFPLETVLDLVFQRGSTMHSLVARDEHGRSNYRMGALRPNQFGVDDEHVVEYVDSIAQQTGEFLQIVNFNLAGSQYSIAGTVAGLEALAADAQERAANYGGKRPFMYVPGIDVPFHSTVLRGGVDEFRKKLQDRITDGVDPSALVGNYIPNLVARPFELTRDFAQAILDVVPSQAIEALVACDEAWDSAAADPEQLARTLLIELLCWQFASPVRWIETQRVLFSDEPGALAVDEVVEVGLGAAPTLANLASRTLAQPAFAGRNVDVFNVQRDAARVMRTDVNIVTQDDEDEAPADSPVEAQTAPLASAAPVAQTPVSTSVAATSTAGPSGADVADLPFTASSAIRVLLALSAKIRLDEVGDSDTTESLTNGVSSRRNQLLMDLSAELGLSSIDGAGEADIKTLSVTVDKAARGYKAFGPVLGEAIKDRTRKLFGAAGVKASRVADRVTGTWQLTDGWANHVTAEILLGTREGASTREGELAVLNSEAPSNAAGVDALIDQAVQSVAARHGISVALPSAGGSAGAGVVDSAALDAFAAQVTGPDGILANTARQVLNQLGLDTPVPTDDEDEDGAAAIEAISAELGSGWVDLVEPRFDARRAVLLDDRWASAREDVARLATQGELDGSPVFLGAGDTVGDHADWWADRTEAVGKSDLSMALRAIAQEARVSGQSLTDRLPYRKDVALVTGMTPSSIAGGVVARLLRGGATVIATSSNISASRLAFAKRLYRQNAAPGAKLWLLPANLASYRDIDAVTDWIGSEQTKTVGADVQVTKEAMVPTLFFPFAAPRVSGTMAEAGPASENQYRLLVWSVERTIANLSRIGADTHADHRVHVVLPGSPNRGMFGGDGAYGEAKASFDAITTRWSAEPIWSSRISIAHPLIGWVRGTGLMGGNDPLVDAVEKAGVRTWSTQEMADALLELASEENRSEAARGPIHADLTGGLDESIDLRALRDQAIATPVAHEEPVESVTVSALPSPTVTAVPHLDPADWGQTTASLEDTVVIVGHGEVGPWGSARTRAQAELGIHSDGTVDLTPAGVLELAWMTGLLTWSDTPVGGWYDAEDQLVDESDIFERYRDEVVARCGIRFFEDDGPLHNGWTPESAMVFLDQDITFTVDDEDEARSYLDADPQFTQIARTPFGEWQVTRKAGAQVRVPKRATLDRRIGGLFPTGFDPARWGIPTSLIDSIDPIAVWNLVSAVDAFVSAGFSPTELLQIVHPSTVASTQGTGFGGMRSMHKLFVDRFLGEDYPQDILQETLPNVVAAHTMQSYVGGYGSMINPVGACATAAVSIEEGVDKLFCGKADFVVAGAIDDIQVESIVGFGSMNATANSNDMLAQGISHRFVSRANDRRRAGFVEAQGGGTVLLTRASIAVEMGLPVLAVVAHAQTFADGAHTSIPAPGIGALGVARAGQKSALARNLAALGVTIDDVAVVSKHDTSTNANDPNESDLHTRIGRALGRSEGNPLMVISQKTLTGHAKGGACVFQVGGIIDVFRTGIIPANAALDCVDDKMAQYPHLVWLRSPLDTSALGPIRAAFATSLGFGHVSGILALVNPGAFEAIVQRELGEDRLKQWRVASDSRLRAGTRTVEAGMLGHAPLFEPVEGRRLPATDVTQGAAGDPHEVEAALLLDPRARLGEDGIYHLPEDSNK
ncbi:type I polyketide synthase [Schaalia vaccimaxillae]|uniref:type I polyketide synthase n=1 Tax=Schaalia vaccimaxillae TaxID=183916 RepID=UPI0003B6003B|nr:type I polyketide synthase [Schaalia vaccimaxillae]